MAVDSVNGKVGTVTLFQQDIAGNGSATTVVGAGSTARSLAQRWSDWRTLMDYGAVAAVNADAAFNAAKSAQSSRMVSLGDLTFTKSAYPDTLANPAAEPVYAFGSITVGATTYPQHSLGSVISHTSDTQLQHTHDRVALYASDRSRAKGSQVAIIGSSRVLMEHSDNPYGGANCAVALGCQNQDLTGLFKTVAGANRYCELSGQSATQFGSLMCRIFGYGGMTDFLGRYGLPQLVFDETVPNASTYDAGLGETFYQGQYNCAGADIVGGSGCVQVAARGTIANGGDTFSVTTSVKSKGSHTFTHARNASVIDGVQTFVGGSNNAVTDENTQFSGMLWASGGYVKGAQMAGVIASSACDIDGGNISGLRENKAIIASNLVSVRAGRGNAAISTLNAYQGGSYSLMAGSRGGENVGNYNIALTYTTAAKPASPTGANVARKFVADGVTGNLLLAGTVTSSGLDYAELMENAELGAIAPGTVLVREGAKVAIGTVGDERPIAGVLSVTPTVVGGDDDEWRGKYSRDEWGRREVIDVPMVRWSELVERGVAEHVLPRERAVRGDDGELGASETVLDPVQMETERHLRDEFDGRLEDVPAGVEIPEDAVYYTLPDWKISSDYDPSRPFVRRQDRPEEWSVVGYLGQIKVRVHEPVSVNDRVGPGGVRADTSGIVVMKVEKPFSAEAGYGIALCYVNVAAGA